MAVNLLTIPFLSNTMTKRTLALVCLFGACFIPAAHAATIEVDVTDDDFRPSKVEVRHGDTVVFHNESTILHSVHLVGRVFRFGKKHFIHDALIYPRRAYSFTVSEEMKPGVYTLGCGLHDRMRSTMVVKGVQKDGSKLLREGERRMVP